jgi:tricorn protease-like protein
MPVRALVLPHILALTGLLAALGVTTAGAQRADSTARSPWDVTLARGTTRSIDFTTSEGTWMSVDLAPDGSWLVFDVLGHIYRLPAGGGEATALTQNSGVALNFQPRISPDGRTIAFISDRRGQYNLWVMNADGSNPRAVFSDLNATAFEPTWTPDGRFIAQATRGARQGPPAAACGRPRDGGTGVSLVTSGTGGSNSAPPPTISGDGKYLYSWSGRTSRRTSLADSLSSARSTFDGEQVDITAGETSTAATGRFSQGGGTGGITRRTRARLRPTDSRWRAVVQGTPLRPPHRALAPGPQDRRRAIADGPDRADGGERVEDVRRVAALSLGADGKSILITQGGKLRRVDVATRAVATIPFTARVHRTISEMARREFRIEDSPLDVKFFRWSSASPDGKQIAFQAVGRVYVQDGASGTPRRLTPASFGPSLHQPSPDGKWISFVTG